MSPLQKLTLNAGSKAYRLGQLVDLVDAFASTDAAPPPSLRFPGDPGLNKVFVGSHEPTPQWPVGQTTIPTRYIEGTYGPLAVVRRFYQDSDSWSGLAADLAEDKAAGRASWVSCKPGTTFYNRDSSQLAARYAAMLDFFTTLKNADHVIIASAFHEPENDDGTTQHYADWGECQTQWNNARAEVVCPKVITSGILMSYTYRTTAVPVRPWADWTIANEPNDIQGIDYYAYATNPTANKVLVSTPLYDVMNGTSDATPLAFAELGQTRSIGNTAWQNAMNAFYDLAAEESWPFICYFDSAFNSVEEWVMSTEEIAYYNETLRQKSYAVTL